MVSKQKKILVRIAQIESDIAELNRVRMELATSGTASANISGGAGSKSYTRLDLGKISELINVLTRELSQLRNLLRGLPANPIGVHYVCWG